MTSFTSSNGFSAALSSRALALPHISELHDKNFLDVLIPSTNDTDDLVIIEGATEPRNPMMDALNATSHRTRTANGAPAYNSTLSSILDAFSTLSTYSFGSVVGQCLDDAWKDDPALTLRLIWNLRSIHDGLGEKELFYRAFGWLYDNHPRTAIANLHFLVDPACYSPKKQKVMPHGYWKDLLNILALATVDELSNISAPSRFLHCPRDPFTFGKNKKTKTGTPASRIEASRAAAAIEKGRAAARRKIKAEDDYRRLVDKLSQPKFRALYIAVARLFADQLVKDVKVLAEIQSLKSGQGKMSLMKQISFAGKWAPTPGGSHDRVTNISTAISELIYLSQTFPSPSVLKNPLPAQERAVVLRSFYQRWVLTELRRISGCPEPLMSAGRWTAINYSRVPSIAMKNNTPNFFMHDPTGFEAYLTSVENNKKSISGATLLPHELVGQIFYLQHNRQFDDTKGNVAMNEFKAKLRKTKVRVVEAQWKTLLENLRGSGTLDNCLALCDVSGSMGSLATKYNKNNIQPILPSISLSLLLASIAMPPFHGGFVTFSSHPQYVKIDLTKPLYDQVETMRTSDWGQNTDLNAVFLDLLLPLAIENKIKQEDMIKRLFIFSDMQFDMCYRGNASSTWATNYDKIEQAYKEAGYDVPQIVYWDLAAAGTTKTVEVESDRKGVAMMNGFSPAMLKVFMGEDEKDEKKEDTVEWEKVDEDGQSVTVVEKVEEDPFTPLNVMKKALLRKSYDGLVVLD